VTVAILHHAGDGNVPPVRVAHTLALARSHPDAIVLFGLRCGESDVVQAALGGRRITSDGAADTLAEIRVTMSAVRALGVDTLLQSTEPGHLARAYPLARILYWRRGVRVIASPSAPGAYLSPWWLTARDVLRALWVRVVG